MPEPSAGQHFSRGVIKLKQGDILSALVHFEKAASISRTPEVISYLGFCAAKERGQFSGGLHLCREALDEDPGNPVHYLNMARIFLLLRDKVGAMEALRKGAACGNNEEIKALLEEIGTRKPPLFSSLDRNHLLNRYFGMILNRLRLR